MVGALAFCESGPCITCQLPLVVLQVNCQQIIKIQNREGVITLLKLLLTIAVVLRRTKAEPTARPWGYYGGS